MELTSNESFNIDSFLLGKTKKKYLFLFDWDDTLFPSTFLNKHGYYKRDKIPVNIHSKIKLLENIILDIFKNIISFSELVIVTNSDEGWVTTSCKLFMPNLHMFIERNVPRFSAKNIYNVKYPGEPILWKAKIMKCILKKFYGDHKNKYVISVGDSVVENTAIKTVSKLLNINTITVIKFMTAPTINQLWYQLIQFKGDIENLCNKKHNQPANTV